MRRTLAGFSVARECELSYTPQKRAPTFRASPGGYSPPMNEGIYFADAELPFHVWVRERTGDEGYRWVLKEAWHDSSDAGEMGPPESDAGNGPA